MTTTSFRAQLENAVNALSLPSQRDAFNAIGIAYIDSGDIINVTDLVEAGHLGQKTGRGFYRYPRS